MLVVPLQPTASQVVTVTLASQPCRLSIYQKRNGLYVDLFLNDEAVITGVHAEDANRIVRDAYLGFVGDFTFLDTQGSANPDYTGLGGRFVLVYLEASDL